MDSRKTLEYNHKFYLLSALLPGAVHKWTNITRVRERGIRDQQGANSQNFAYQSQHNPLGSQLVEFKIEVLHGVFWGFGLKYPPGPRDTMCDIRRIKFETHLPFRGLVPHTMPTRIHETGNRVRSLNLEIRRQSFRDFHCNILITPFKSWGTPQPDNQFFIYIYGM